VADPHQSHLLLAPKLTCEHSLTWIICLQVPGDFQTAVEPTVSKGSIVLVCGKKNTHCMCSTVQALGMGSWGTGCGNLSCLAWVSLPIAP
jgi:hypothetical protein